MAPPFEEDDPSDPDSISLTSTREPSDAEAEWAVEKVLAECVDKDSGETKYLIKWEGYPLHDCSWEPAENLKSPSILLEWRIDQQAVADGVKQPFDLDDFFEAWEINAEAREGRKARRKAKRRRLGIPSRSASVDVDSADDDDDDDDVEMEDAPEDGEVSSPARSKKVGTPLPKQKGVAQTVKRSLNRRNVAASSSEESSGGEDDGGSTSEDSLLEEARKSASKCPSHKASGSRPNDVTSFTAAATSKITKNKSPTKTPRPVASKPSATEAANPPKTAVRTGARKSAPSTGSTTAQPSGQPRTQATGAAPQRKAAASPSPPPRRQPAPNIMRNFARPPPDPRQRVRSGNDPRELRFGSLSEQNRFHKHAAREKAPDPSLLATFNPATGRMVAPPAAMEKAPDPSRFDPVAGRLDVPSAAATTSSEPIRDATHRTAERSMLPPPAPPVAPMGSAMRSTSPTKTAQPPQPPVPPAQNPSLNSGPSAPAPVAATAPRVARPTAAPSVFGRREAPAPERHRSASPPSSPGQRRLMSTDSYGHRRDREKSITCRDWAKGECLKSDGDCWFAHFYVRKYTCGWWRIGNCKYSAKDCIGGHYDTGNELTCPFWLDGHCSKPKALCHYAHYDTGMRAPKPGGHRGPVPTMGSNGPVVQHDEARTVLTCPFWLDGGCFRSEADCKYAHYDTGLRATKRGEKGGPVPTGLNNPNHQPLPADKPRFQHSPLHQPHFQQSPAHHSPVQQSPRSPAVSPGHDADGGAPVFNDGPGPNMMASSDKMNPVAARGSLSVQRPSGPPAFTHSVALKITCGTELDVSAKLACAVKEDLIQLSSVMHSQARLELQRSVNASDLQHQLADVLEQGAQYPCGEVIFDSHNDKLKKLVEALKQEVCCGTVLDDRFTLLVYPAGTEDWKFFNRDGDVTSSQAALKFKLLPPLPDVAQSMSSSVAPNLSGLKTSPSELLVARLEGIDVDRMVMHSETKQEVRAFIMMPPSRAMEMDLIAEVIKSRIDPKQVKTSRDPGAWADLIASGRGSCLVILHPDIPLWSIHHLGTALHFRIFRIFSVGVNPGLATLERREPRFESQRLFETGDVVFISDYVFLNDPMKALELIKEVCRMNSIKPPGALRSKVAARPGVRLWLMNLAIERTGDRGREDIHWIQLLEAVCKLCPPELEDKLYPGNPSDKADLVSAAPESVPSFQVALEVDPGKALDFAVHWFAGWAYMNAASFRRFAVCHEVEGTGEQVFDEHGRIVKRNVQADPSGWGEEYKYLIVRTPDQWLNDVRERQSKNQTLRMGP